MSKKHTQDIIKNICKDLNVDDKQTAQFLKKYSKTKKDPDAPKRPKSAFILFCDDHREKIKSAENPSSIGELSKLLGEKWKLLSDEEKQVYQKKYLHSKEKYDEIKQKMK